MDIFNILASPFLAFMFFFAYAWVAKADGVDTYLAAHINLLQNEKLDRDGEIPCTGTMQWDKGADVASAANLLLGADGNYFDITGTTTITQITAAQSQPGTVVKLHFDSSLIIEHDGDNIVLPGAVNITVRAGDELEFVENTAGKWRLTNWYSASKKNLINLLPNSGFGLWSWSGLAQGATGVQSDYEIGSAIYDEDAEGVDDSGNWTKTDCTMAKTNDPGNGAGGSDNYYTITETAATQRISQILAGLTPGKLYKFSIWIKNGTGTWANAVLKIMDSALISLLAYTNLATEAAWADYSVIFEATETNNQMVIDLALGGGETAKLDTMQVIEVGPGCFAADSKAPDGWQKTASLGLLRVQNDTVHCSGYYGIRVTKSTDDSEYIFPFALFYNQEYHYTKYRGKTVTFGCYLYSVSVNNNVKIAIADSDGRTESSFCAADTLTWIEISRECGVSITAFKPEIRFEGDNGDIAYISQPMLIVGPEIGEGNYNQTKDEIIFCENDIASHRLDGVSGLSDGGDTLRIRQDTSGKIPQDAKGLFMHIKAGDSASAATQDCYVYLRGVTYSQNQLICSVGGLANDAYSYVFGLTPCDENGNIYYQIAASGAGTFSIHSLRYRGVLIGG